MHKCARPAVRSQRRRPPPNRALRRRTRRGVRRWASWLQRGANGPAPQTRPCQSYGVCHPRRIQYAAACGIQADVAVGNYWYDRGPTCHFGLALMAEPGRRVLTYHHGVPMGCLIWKHTTSRKRRRAMLALVEQRGRRLRRRRSVATAAYCPRSGSGASRSVKAEETIRRRSLQGAWRGSGRSGPDAGAAEHRRTDSADPAAITAGSGFHAESRSKGARGRSSTIRQFGEKNRRHAAFGADSVEHGEACISLPPMEATRDREQSNGFEMGCPPSFHSRYGEGVATYVARTHAERRRTLMLYVTIAEQGSGICGCILVPSDLRG